MPIVSQFYGIIIKMYFNEDTGHHMPHLHAEYAEFHGVFDFRGKMLEGNIPNKQRKMIEVWIGLHIEELFALWKAMQEHDDFFKINPLV